MITDTLTAIGLIGGASLMALGGIGLLRFPDVLTRMHAATKAATVGVIGITAVAATRAGTSGGLALLLLVIALLFLSAPLGMSLLARAAYHDPETPLFVHTRELETIQPPTPPAPAGRSTGASPLLAVWLMGAWVAAFGSVRPNVIAGGIVIAGTTAFALRRLAPRWPHALAHPFAAIRFAGHFLSRVVAGTAGVVWALRLRRRDLRPALVEIPITVTTRNEITLLMNAVSFTPGTVALELHDRSLVVHVLDVADPDTVVAEVTQMENRIRAAFSDRRRNANHVIGDV